jgi:hypothetical protein
MKGIWAELDSVANSAKLGRTLEHACAKAAA